MPSELALATAVLALVTVSFPFYVYGAWIVLDAEVVTWAVLRRHLAVVFTGLALTTGPVVVWMLPRAADQIGGLLAVHAFFGLQAYAMLLVGLTGIVRILQVKRAHDRYADPDPDVPLDDLHEHASAWRRRLRLGVFGYVVFWIVAYLLGVVRYVLRYRVG
ncbi:DUF7321 family protein [Salinilacihabitans rarus]|uniref:DUF7321 family protein n=1 Tax=Salinilacihabitans rarus TaxID=2961596 RepID=UPI0020C872CD|nr:hypothetical protein [Salinilacihabitans rarus]